MRKIFYLVVGVLVLCLASCEKNDDYKTYSVKVQLVYPGDSGLEPVAGVAVKMTNSSGSVTDATTNEEGKATFTVTAGVYEVSASEVRTGNAESYILNGIESVTVSDAWDENSVVNLSLTSSTKGQVVIKELYVGGCQKDDGSGVFQTDKYVILYNNSTYPASLTNLCLGMVLPYNSNATNNDYVDGKLFYEVEKWIPAGNGIWYLGKNVTLAAGEQMVIALNNAIDNTLTYSNSVNLANGKYYSTYDPESGYNNTASYSVSDEIPPSNYFSAIRYGLGNAWPLSGISPAFYIFTTKDSSPEAFGSDPNNLSYHGGSTSQAQLRKKVPADWIIDGIEVFTTTSETNKKRLTPDIDGGQVYLENKQGYTLYRNVDLEATKAIEGNEAKLVYNYAFGTEVNGNPSTDPSGVDAEASIKNGALIIYKDTNNSTNDFHQRKQASLRID